MTLPARTREVSPSLAVIGPRPSDVLTDDAMVFLAELATAFGPRVVDRLRARRERRERLARGERLDFLTETSSIRAAEWSIAKVPGHLKDRRVEITGPVEPKMIINALNSGAKVFMADFEDATTPSWDNLLMGQRALMQAARGTLTFTAPEGGKLYSLGSKVATLFARPRGLHLPEKHLTLEGQPIPGALFDFGLYFFHNARPLLERGGGPYFYLPKLESHTEARLWNDIFSYAEGKLGLPVGTIKATVLIETLPAAFEMDEILYELREHSAGLNCGRWDYIFSFIKTRRDDPAALLPDRAQLKMDRGFLLPYTELLIKTCHRRGAHAMGGMAAQIPIKGDPEAGDAALRMVRADKLREVSAGHDGTWVAHPGLVPVAREIFDAHMTGENQLDRKRDDVRVMREDLLRVPSGTMTEQGLRQNIRVGLRYLESWLRGAGCVPLYNLMEDAATAEICRTQVWQWRKHGATLDNGQRVDGGLVSALIDEELEELVVLDETWRRYAEAKQLFKRLCLQDELEDFLTLPAYEQLLSLDKH